MSAQARDTITQSSPVPTTDAQAIGQFWDAMVHPGVPSLNEMRIIRRETTKFGKPLIDSCYVDDRQAFIDVARRIHPNYALGAYLTLNTVDPTAAGLPAHAFAARADQAKAPGRNRLATRVGKTTTDDHIARRRHLLIDVDAANPTGVSATDAERDAALAGRDAVHAYLDGLGWRARVVTCSGNGGGLIYDIDVANDDPSRQLVKRVLEALDARFTTPAATIDVANSNAARITRIPGTVTAKGAHTSERPWRQATAIYPEGAGVVTRTQLEAVAALALATTRRTTTRGGRIDAGMSASDDGGEGDDYARMLEEGAPEGRRRLTMTRLVGHYLHRGLGQREIGALLRPWADRCHPPVPYAHLDGMIRSLAASEARKRPPDADDGDGSPGDDDEGRQGADGGSFGPPLTQRERVQRGALQRAYATITDLTAQVKAWEHLQTSKTFPDKAGDVLIHMHKRLGVLIGQHLPDDMGDRKIYIDEADIAAEGIPRSAFNEGRDILFNMGLLTREKRKKKSVAAPAGEGNDSAATRAAARGKDWCYLWGINGPAVNALWPQLPTITEIPLTPQQIKAAGSRQARLEDAITREKPTPQVVHALKREAAAERAEKDRAIYEYRVAAQERDNARDQAEAAAGERDRALHEAQRIIQENQRPPTPRLICHECGTIGDPAAWRCDDCRERERKEAGDSMLGFNTESERGRQGGTVTNMLKPNIESAGQSAEDLRPCAGGCGTPTPHGWTCKACLARPLGALHVPMDYAPRQEVSHGS